MSRRTSESESCPLAEEDGKRVGFWSLSYSQRQLVRSHFKSAGPPKIFLMWSRGRAQLQYLLLRLDKCSFWTTIIGMAFALVVMDWCLFMASEDPRNALALALDANDSVPKSI